jgi:hypothetical protein
MTPEERLEYGSCIAGAFNEFLPADPGFNLEADEWVTIARFLAMNPLACADLSQLTADFRLTPERKRIDRIASWLDHRIIGLQFTVKEHEEGMKVVLDITAEDTRDGECWIGEVVYDIADNWAAQAPGHIQERATLAYWACREEPIEHDYGTEEAIAEQKEFGAGR